VLLSERRPGQTFSSNQASPQNVYAPPRNIKRMNAAAAVSQVSAVKRKVL